MQLSIDHHYLKYMLLIVQRRIDMNFYDILSVAKLFAIATGNANHITMSSTELEIASETLKKLADERRDWTTEQKEYYKLLVDYIKEQTKESKNEKK